MKSFAKIFLVLIASATVFTGCASTQSEPDFSIKEFRSNYNNRYFSNDSQARRDDAMPSVYATARANGR